MGSIVEPQGKRKDGIGHAEHQTGSTTGDAGGSGERGDDGAHTPGALGSDRGAADPKAFSISLKVSFI